METGPGRLRRFLAPVEEFIYQLRTGRIEPILAERPEVIPVQRREDQSSINIIARQDIVLISLGAVLTIDIDGQRDIHLLALPPQSDRNQPAILRLAESRAHEYPVSLIKNGAVAAHGIRPDLQQHIILLHQFLRFWHTGINVIHSHAQIVVRQLQPKAIGRVLQSDDAVPPAGKPS